MTDNEKILGETILPLPNDFGNSFDASMMFLSKIGLTELERRCLFELGIERDFLVIKASKGAGTSRPHFQERFMELAKFQALLAQLPYENPLEWIEQFNSWINCRPIDILRSCELEAFRLAIMILERDLAGEKSDVPPNRFYPDRETVIRDFFG